jgi:hypothetical protein
VLTPELTDVAFHGVRHRYGLFRPAEAVLFAIIVLGAIAI